MQKAAAEVFPRYIIMLFMLLLLFHLLVYVAVAVTASLSHALQVKQGKNTFFLHFFDSAGGSKVHTEVTRSK